MEQALEVQVITSLDCSLTGLLEFLSWVLLLFLSWVDVLVWLIIWRHPEAVLP